MFFSLTKVELIYSIVLFSGVQQNGSVIYMCIYIYKYIKFSDSFPLLNILPLCYMVVVLVVYFMHSSDPCFLRSHQPKCRQQNIKTSHWGSLGLLPLFTGLAPLHLSAAIAVLHSPVLFTIHVPAPHVALL